MDLGSALFGCLFFLGFLSYEAIEFFSCRHFVFGLVLALYLFIIWRYAIAKPLLSFFEFSVVLFVLVFAFAGFGDAIELLALTIVLTGISCGICGPQKPS